jgi:hypothetical protein
MATKNAEEQREVLHTRKGSRTTRDQLEGSFEFGRTLTFGIAIQTGKQPSPPTLANFTAQNESC